MKVTEGCSNATQRETSANHVHKPHGERSRPRARPTGVRVAKRRERYNLKEGIRRIDL
jgi:hypothetical protein